MQICNKSPRNVCGTIEDCPVGNDELINSSRLINNYLSMLHFQAALRKISGICSLEVNQDAADRLITPKLMDSFIACSNIEESIV